MKNTADSIFRENISRMEGYTPGEQPQDDGWVKLNTNENPYPPSPRVAEAVERAARGRLQIYPDPLAKRFCEVAAEVIGCDADCILPANGSDENLTILLRTFVEAGESIAFPYPSYSLYRTLAEIQGAHSIPIPLSSDWSWNLEEARPMIEKAKIVFVPNPNSPSGNLWSADEIVALAPPNGILVVDQAYIDFSEETQFDALWNSEIADRLVITRSLSKSYSLAGIRMGFAIARPELIHGMRKVKDSYNCNALSLAAGTAALEDREWIRQNTRKICETRSKLVSELEGMGFQANRSQANFVWVTHSSEEYRTIYEKLKKQKILVRFMSYESLKNPQEKPIDGLRISVGTDDEIDRLISSLKEIV